LQWVLATTLARLRTASVRQDHRKYCVLVLRTHPVGSVVSSGFVTMRRVYRDGRRHLVLSGASMGRGCHESVMGIVMNGT